MKTKEYPSKLSNIIALLNGIGIEIIQVIGKMNVIKATWGYSWVLEKDESVLTPQANDDMMMYWPSEEQARQSAIDYANSIQ